MDPNIIAAIIGASAGAGIAIITIIVKDIIIHSIREKQKEKNTFKLYANPLIRASESLCWRLKEIFEQRGAFLLKREPKNTFFEYKFISTIFRLCVLIGWIRAIYREFAYIYTSNSSGSQEIEASINSFQKALADGQHMELSILKELAKCWNINIDKISNEEQAILSVDIAVIIYNYIKSSNTFLASNLAEDIQNKLLAELSCIICDKIKCSKVNESVIIENRNKAIQEISRIENWIYRDWQNAVGDLMLKEIENSPRKYDIIGFGEFDTLLLKENKWIKRVVRLFENLNVEIDDRFDGRVGQLKRIYNASVGILTAFNKLNKNQKTISDKSLKLLTEFKSTVELRIVG